MDRNSKTLVKTILPVVALRKESVDRNISLNSITYANPLSLSARRAWIEIYTPDEEFEIDEVALRKESVDRNESLQNPIKVEIVSLSARRAWIEIQWYLR